jgi:hypothetical protein
MKSSILAFVLAAMALVGLALPTPSAAAATQLDNLQKSLRKRVAGFDVTQGLCVCAGGDLDGIAGLIGVIPDENGIGLIFSAACFAVHFDATTGEISETDICDEDWVPIPS